MISITKLMSSLKGNIKAVLMLQVIKLCIKKARKSGRSYYDGQFSINLDDVPWIGKLDGIMDVSLSSAIFNNLSPTDGLIDSESLSSYLVELYNVNLKTAQACCGSHDMYRAVIARALSWILITIYKDGGLTVGRKSVTVSVKQNCALAKNLRQYIGTVLHGSTVKGLRASDIAGMPYFD